MKSTYNLLNIYLDGQSLPGQVPRVLEAAEVSECSELEEEISIFDFPICRRKISGMKLLSFRSELEFFNLISRLPDCKELFIFLDYNSPSKTAYNLFLKRVLQSASLIIKQYPSMDITFVGDGSAQKVIKHLYTN